VRIPVPEALENLEGVVDDIVLVNDDAIKYELNLVYKNLKLVCEPAGHRTNMLAGMTLCQ
jgi:threonine dehydratase